MHRTCLYAPRMSFNVGGIYVDKEIPATRVAEAIKQYWTSKGARIDKSDPRKLEPLTVEKTKQLGYAIVSAGGQIAIADSERYTADHGLAAYLAKELEAPVFWYALYGATDVGVAAWFGAKKNKKTPVGFGEIEAYVSAHFAPPFVHLQELRKTSKTDVLLSFSDVKGYDAGPEEEDEEEEPEEAPREPARAASPKAGGWALDATKRAPFTPIRAGKTQDAARDNLVIVFYASNPKETACAKIFDAYQRAIPPDVLRWALIGASSTDVRPTKPGAMSRAAGQFKRKGGFFFVASDDDPSKPDTDEPSIPAYAFVFSAAEDKGEATRLELRFPSDVVWQAGADTVFAFAKELVAALGDSLVSGSCSIALSPFPLLSSLRDGGAMYREAAKHIGLDILTEHMDALGGLVRSGARWVDFIGPRLAQKVAAKKLTGVTVESVGKSLALRTSHEPAIDPDGAALKALQTVAKALDPFALYKDPFVDFDCEPKQRNRWERRFVDAPRHG